MTESEVKIKRIRISATITAIATIMTFATFFTATTTAYAQTNTTGNATTAGAAKPASSSPSSASMQSPAGSVANINSSTVTIQKTGVSDTDPVNSAHQLVSALPPRSDGKVWVGTVTWTASKPVEVVVLHRYNSNVTR